MEEFSFPTIVENQKPIFQLPFPTSGTLLFSSKPSTNSTRRSFSLVEGAFDVANHSLTDKDFKPSSPALSDYGSGGGNYLLEDEERMDKLWEDFNDDFFCASPDRDRSGVQMMSRRRTERIVRPTGAASSVGAAAVADAGCLKKRASNSIQKAWLRCDAKGVEEAVHCSENSSVFIQEENTIPVARLLYQKRVIDK
ncbi:uncharacterized protein [Typha angustifolia]|uniref:uncharacterized protein isoform X1 n=1 Tax=Typha angustifolia TaxID=59011 RepID=UPI003C2E0420